MTNKINGIDVSEYFIDVVDEGGSTIDYKILPNSERLLVEKIFEQNQQLKRLQEENKRLQMLSCANCGEKYLSPDGAELYEKNVQLQKENEKQKELIKQLEDFIKSDGEIDHINHEYTYKLQKENEWLKKKKDEYYLINLDYETKISYLIQALEEINILAKNYCNACDEFKAKTYKALEEMRKEANRLLFVENPIYGYNNSNYFEILAKHVLAKTNEVLNDRN